MTIEFDFVESDYKFTTPIRKFKQNDPYFWKIDNIPLEQLEDNVLWLKDQITNGALKFSEVPRGLLSELQPYATGGDRIVRVKPGRFTGRVNDAYNKNNISNIILSGVSTNNPGVYTDDKDINYYVQLASNLLFSDSYDSSKALNLNGLETLASIWSTKGPESASDVEYKNGVFQYTHNSKLKNAVPPGSDRQVQIKNLIDDINLTHQDFHDHQAIHNMLTQKWRGVSRLAIVDVPEELSLEIDAYSDDDFDASSTPSDAYRIDLVFVYTHPIDASSTTISTKQGTSPKTITKAELGVVKGAGYIHANNITNETTADKSILANINDLAFDANTGVSGIHGSFPAPDDLMNIAPLLMEQLETTDERLIGQSILPVAYVVIKKTTTSTTTTGKGIINANDVIDIRPFLRSAELTYGERAGISAANPPLSFANPAVGKAELYDTESRVIDFLNTIESNTTQSSVWAKGTIYGGLKYGPEGTLMMMSGAEAGGDYASQTGDWSPDAVLETLGIQPTTVQGNARYIPDLPEWDTRDEVEDAGDLQGIDVTLAGYINTYVARATMSYINNYYKSGPPALGKENIRMGYDDGALQTVLRFVSKKIQVKLPDWAVDYDVKLQYENCIPTTHPGGSAGGGFKDKFVQTFNGMFVSKRKIVDNVATFVIISTIEGAMGGALNDNHWPRALITRVTGPEALAGFAVPKIDSVGDFSFDTYSHSGLTDFFTDTGVCIIPTVSFSVIAYSGDNVTDEGGSIL